MCVSIFMYTCSILCVGCIVCVYVSMTPSLNLMTKMCICASLCVCVCVCVCVHAYSCILYVLWESEHVFVHMQVDMFCPICKNGRIVCVCFFVIV